MKTIKEAAIELYKSTTFKSDLPAQHPTAMFEAGVRFAEEWINVTDELPNRGVLVLLKVDNDDDLVSTGLHNGEYFRPDFRFCSSGKVTHWRPINRK